MNTSKATEDHKYLIIIKKDHLIYQLIHLFQNKITYKKFRSEERTKPIIRINGSVKKTFDEKKQYFSYHNQ